MLVRNHLFIQFELRGVYAYIVITKTDQSHRLPCGEPCQVWDEYLDCKYAIRGQMPGGILEAANLFFMRKEGKKGVNHHVDERILTVDVDIREITHGNRNFFTTGLGVQFGDHRFRSINAIQ